MRQILVFFLTLLAVQLGAEENALRKAENHTLSELNENEWTEPYFFIQLADPQIGMSDWNKSVDKDLELLLQAVEHINRLQPRFVIICGDLTNVPFGKEHFEEQLDALMIGIEALDPKIPLLVLPGNHDVGNHPTFESIAKYESIFGSAYYSFCVDGVRYLALNSALYCSEEAPEELVLEQNQWLDAQLAQKEPSIGAVFTHHPPFLESLDEEDNYYAFPSDVRQEFIAKLENAGVKLCFSGHYHRNSYGKSEGLDVVTSCSVGLPLGESPSGLRIVKVYEDHIEHEYYGFDEVPEEVSAS